jgi:hypothetical protein
VFAFHGNHSPPDLAATQPAATSTAGNISLASLAFITHPNSGLGANYSLRRHLETGN